MAIYKRRIVYLSDEEWAWCSARAKDHGNTVSAEIRGLMLGDWRPIEVPYHKPDRPGSFQGAPADLTINNTPTRKSQQAERDRILRAVNKG